MRDKKYTDLKHAQKTQLILVSLGHGLGLQKHTLSQNPTHYVVNNTRPNKVMTILWSLNMWCMDTESFQFLIRELYSIMMEQILQKNKLHIIEMMNNSLGLN